MSVELIGDPPYGRLANYFFPGVSHPSDLEYGLYASGPRDAYGIPYRRWVNANGGVPLHMTAFQLVIQCVGDHNVMLVGGHAITTVLGDLRGVAVVHPSGGPIDSDRLEINLEDGELLCFPYRAPFEPSEPIPLQYQIEPSRSQSFDVYASVGSQALSWYLELDFLVDGKRITKTVTQSKEAPFVTVPFGHPGIEAEFHQTETGWERI
ncbi:hypothetical protein CH275_14705 [Rhodococcus sp. 06-235-1A]|nr:hypothetical protein CH275_14705 [Rhodococcus sp. 06-235-1A]